MTLPLEKEPMHAPHSHPAWIRHVLILVGYALFYLWSLYFYMGGNDHVAVWLSFGFLAGWLIRLETRHWALIVVGATAVEVALSTAVTPVLISTSMFFAVIHVGTASLAAALFKVLSTSRDRFETSKDVAVFALAPVLMAPAVGAFFEKVYYHGFSGGAITDDNFWIDLVSMSNGVIYLTPLVLYWGRLRDKARAAYQNRSPWIHFLVVAVPLLLYRFVQLPEGSPHGFWIFVFSGLVSALVATSLFGMWGALSTTTAVVLVTAHLARTSAGFLEVFRSQDGIVLLTQIGILGMGVLATYALAVLLREMTNQRQRVQQEMEQHEALFSAVPVGLLELDQSHVKTWLDMQMRDRRADCRSLLTKQVSTLRELIGQSSFRVNPAVASFYGFPSTESLLEHSRELFRTSPDQLLIDVWCRMYVGENNVHFLTERKLLDGSEAALQIHYRVLPGSETTWSRWLIAVTDVSDSRKHRDQISRLNERAEILSRLLLETERIAHIGSWYWDLSSGEITWSPGMYSINELPEDTAVTLESSLSRVHPADQEWLKRTFEQGITDHRLRYRILLDGGRIRWIESFGIEDRDEHGTVIGLRGFQSDVTDQVLFEDEKGGVSDILETTSVCAYVAEDLERSRLRYVSPGVGQFGWVREELLRSNGMLFGSIPDEHIGRVRRHLASLRPELGHLPVEYPVQTPIGLIWYRDFVRRKKTGPDKAPVFEGILIDISSEMEATWLRQLETRRRDVLTSLPKLLEGKSELAFIQDALALAESLTDSAISFLHFMNDDDSVELVAWSRQTEETYCEASYDRHYPIEKAGIWAEAFHTKKAVIVNEYESAANKKGLPEGHARLDRFISLPVIDNERTVVLAGVGNASRLYTQEDVLSLQIVFNEVWRLVGGARKQRQLEDERLRLRTFFDATYDSFVIYEHSADTDIFRVKYLNRAAEEIGGVSAADALGRDFREVWPGVVSSGIHELIRSVWETGETLAEREVHYVFNNVDQWHDMSAARLPDGTVAVAYRDVSETVRARNEAVLLEKELAASQRMEALGRLAGGVAHDFNNLLGVIIGHAEAGQYATDDPAVLKKHLLQVEDAAMRSAEMTKQLLGFARRQVGQPARLDLVEHVAALMSMLKRLIGENVLLRFEKPDAPMMMEIDPTFVDQIITNLCVNARDAMVSPGYVDIKLERVRRLEVETSWPEECVLDEYFSLSVSDSGHGIDPAIVDNIFEPFFSTRETGTGLGLSTVFGVVRQISGHIDIQSEVGVGTTVHIFLPPAPESTSEA